MRHGLMLAPFGELADPRVVADLAADGERAGGAGLGVNTGGELTRFGEEDDARLRGDRLDEGLELLCRLWSGEEVTHRGPHFTAEGVRFEPRPLQRPRIPIWVAAPSGKPRPPRRAVRYDGICTDIGPAWAPTLLERLREERGASTASTSSSWASREPTRAGGSGPAPPGGSSTSPTRSTWGRSPASSPTARDEAGLSWPS